MIRIAVLASGSGTNLQALLDAQRTGTLASGRIVLVASDNPSAFALERAKQAGVETLALDRRQLGKVGFEKALLEVFDARRIDMIVLAGFLTILSEKVIARYRRRIINIHPSLIPSFCGKGYYGHYVHEAALKRGVKVSGATVHLVDEVADGGPILAQQAIAVQDDDTPDSLGRRILEQVEWKLLPRTVEAYAHKMEYEMRLQTHLAAIRYPGRGILCGLNEKGECIVAYFITARSMHSKNRHLVEDGRSIRTEAIDPTLLVDPSLIIYRAFASFGSSLVVSNGDQTDTIIEGLSANKGLEEALASRTYEPDEPNYTARISALVQLGEKFSYTLSILRRVEGNCERAYFPYEKPRAGEGRLIHTYQGDGTVLPTYSGEPVAIKFEGDASSIAREIWEALDPQYRVALAVKSINLKTKQEQLTIINAQQRRS
ncbi:phosphoribosylglycinamide formyltransferase [Sphaerochaeta sp.]|jgi:phosphoribosylglycinamide formyltransferase-1|uniref:phosphoribosylglycinamide formyltransferase n=1 Tax=Sphaerochaeta sp. TaxID=1972642 RepID=UPI002FC9C3F4